MQRIFGAADQNKYLSEVGELSNDKNRRKIKLRRLRSPLQTDKLVKRMYYDKVEQKNNCSIRDTWVKSALEQISSYNKTT